MLRPLAASALILILAACQPTPEVRRAAPAPEVPLASPQDAGCWARDTVPALTETVFEVDSAGTRHPREVVLRPAEDRAFAVPCDHEMTEDLIASLQRALSVRGLFSGLVNGVMDAPTVEAVRRFQAPLGLDSGILTLDAARALGLIAVPRG
jgi:hypothetical protein